jgi:hypothetical protein
MSGGVMTDSAGGAGDKLVMVGNSSGGISGYGMQFRDYTVQADVSLAGTGDAGILIRASSPAVGVDSVYAYYVGVGSTGVVFMGDMHDGYSSLSGAQANIPGGAPANTWIHLTVTAANCAITVTAQQAGSTSQGSFTYMDGNCAHMGGTIGLRTDAVKASWRNVTINETGASPASNAPYLAPFGSGSSSGWTTYGGSWSLSGGVYKDSTAGLGDKSIVSASSAANLIVQSDVEFGSVSTQPNSGILLGVSSPATGTDSLYGFYAGTGVQSLLLGQESYGWTALTATPYENALTAGQWLHMTVQARECIFTVAAQPLSQQYGYIQTYIYPNCTSSGEQGVREYNASTGFENFSVLPN